MMNAQAIDTHRSEPSLLWHHRALLSDQITACQTILFAAEAGTLGLGWHAVVILGRACGASAVVLHSDESVGGDILLCMLNETSGSYSE